MRVRLWWCVCRLLLLLLLFVSHTRIMAKQTLRGKKRACFRVASFKTTLFSREWIMCAQQGNQMCLGDEPKPPGLLARCLMCNMSIHFGHIYWKKKISCPELGHAYRISWIPWDKFDLSALRITVSHLRESEVFLYFMVIDIYIKLF